MNLVIYASLGCFVAVGLLLHVVGWRHFLREERALRVYRETTCTVLAKKLDIHYGVHDYSDGDGGRRQQKVATYRPDFLIRYRVGDRDYEAWTYDAGRAHTSGFSDHDAILARFAVGGRYPCWYDPDDPGEAVLARGHTTASWFGLLFPLIFVAVGAFGIAYRVRRPDRPRSSG
jgi:hypothetical protein